MQRFSHLSDHAGLRVDQRTSLNAEAIADQIDRRVYLPLGRVPGFNKEHLLLFSAPDDACFVVVRDWVCGTVITVLPLNYHDAWPVSEAQCAQARGLYESDALAREDERRKALAQASPEPSVFLLNAMVLHDQAYKSTALFKRPAQTFGPNVAALLRSPTLLDEVLEALHAKGYPTSSLLSISVRRGKRGIPTSVAVVHTPDGVHLDPRDLPPLDDPALNDAQWSTERTEGPATRTRRA